MKKPSQLTIDEWTLLYPKFTMKQIAEQLQCGETTVHKWLKKTGIEATKKNRAMRSEEHSKKISIANTGKTREKTGKFNKCEICGEKYYVIPARAKITKFCSTKCKGISISKNNIGSSTPAAILIAVVPDETEKGLPNGV